MLQERRSIPPLGTTHQLPSLRRDLARKWVPETGSRGRSRSSRRTTSSTDNGCSQPLKSCGQSTVDSTVRVAQGTPGFDGCTYRIGEFLVMIDGPATRRSAYHVYAKSIGGGRIVVTGCGLIPPERQASRVPFVEPNGDLTITTGSHHGFIYGHIPRAPRRPIVNQSNHVAPVTSFCDRPPRR